MHGARTYQKGLQKQQAEGEVEVVELGLEKRYYVGSLQTREPMLQWRMKAVTAQTTAPCYLAQTKPCRSFARKDRAQQGRLAGRQEAQPPGAEEVAGRRIRKARAAGD